MCSCFYYSIISIIDELKAYGMLLNLKTFCMVLFPVSDNFVSTETESTAFFSEVSLQMVLLYFCLSHRLSLKLYNI